MQVVHKPTGMTSEFVLYYSALTPHNLLSHGFAACPDVWPHPERNKHNITNIVIITTITILAINIATISCNLIFIGGYNLAKLNISDKYTKRIRIP